MRPVVLVILQYCESEMYHEIVRHGTLLNAIHLLKHRLSSAVRTAPVLKLIIILSGEGIFRKGVR
jgi:hypothetical protein